MPFRMPPPITTTSSNQAPDKSSSSSFSPHLRSPTSAANTSSSSPASTSLPIPITATLRLPGPPLPPKPLHLTISKNSTLSTMDRFRDESEEEGTVKEGGIDREGGGGKGSRGNRRGELPRWSRIGFEGEKVETKKGIDSEGTIKLASDKIDTVKAVKSPRGDRTEEQTRNDGEEPTMEELLGIPSSGSEYRRKKDRDDSADDTFKSAIDTLKVGDDDGGRGGSTIKRKSIYFDPTNENPFLPSSSSTSTPSTPLSRKGDAEREGRIESLETVQVEPSDLSTPTEAASLSSLPPRATSSPAPIVSPQVELPDSPLLAISLHSFSGETSFGELSFSQGIELGIEIEDLGGGWSLGYVKEIGEEGRGLIPRGWYAYIDVDRATKPQEVEKTVSGEPQELIELPSPLATDPPTPSSPSLDDPVKSEDMNILDSPLASVEGYATRSIGRHLVISGTEFEPIRGTEEAALESETLEGSNGFKGITNEEGKSQEDASKEKSEKSEQGEEAESNEEAKVTSPEEPYPATAKDTTTTTSNLPVAVRAEELPAGPTSSLEPSTSSTALPSISGPSRPPPSSAQGSILYRLGLFSPSSAGTTSSSRSYLLGGLSIPGASILAHSHPRRTPSPPALDFKPERMSRVPSVMKGKGYVLEWIKNGDEFDEAIKEDLQIWDIDNDNGPVWRRVSTAFIVQVHSPRKLSPLGETPYTLFRLTTHFDTLPRNGVTYNEDQPPPVTVSRRFSHFVSLHQLLTSHFSLLTIPPLPPKAFGSTRFSDEFVEERKRDLERWIEKIVRHPVLRESEQVRGFLSIDDEKDLQLLLSPSSSTPPSPLFFARVFHPEFNIDLNEAVDVGDRFERHCRAIELGGGIKNVESAIMNVREGLRGNANALQNLSNSLIRLVAGLSLPSSNYDPPPSAEDIEDRFNEVEVIRTARRAKEWKIQNEEGAMSWREEDSEALALSKAIQATGEALAEMSESVDGTARHELVAMQLSLQELSQPATTFDSLISTHKEVVAEYRRLNRLSAFDRADQIEQLARCETILNITCAEMDLIRTQRTEDLKDVVKTLLDIQIEQEEKALDQLRFARGHFDEEALRPLALTGPRLRSTLEGSDPNPHLYPPLMTPRSFMVPQSIREKAGLVFPPSRMRRYLKKGRYAARIGQGAPVFLGAVIEYMCAEVLELAGNAALEHKKSRVTPRHIQLAVRNDEELNRFLGGITISGGGVMPYVHAELLPGFKAKEKKEREKKKKEKAGVATSDDEEQQDSTKY
ncbi:hypothetical protein JCM5350_006358 [Sporobolomyces pararoseus]